MKRVYLSALLLAGIMSGCSKSEVTEVMPENDDLNTMGLNIASATTRGSETTTGSIRTDAVNIDIAYYNSASSSNSKIPFTYVAKDNIWKASNKWSEIEYDAYFYSFHDGAAPIACTSVGDAGAVYGDGTTAIYSYETNGSIAEQKDLIYYKSVYSSMPSNATISGTFDHALARVEFYANTTGYYPYIQTVRFMNINNSSSKAEIAPNSTLSWELGKTSADYLYANLIDPSASLGLEENAEINAMQPINGHILSEVANTKSDATNILMLPQTCTASSAALTALKAEVAATPDAEPGSTTSDGVTVDGAYVTANATFAKLTVPYVQVLYRMRDESDDKSVVGFKHVKDAQGYQNLKAAAAPAEPELYPEDLGENDRLYALVGFPFSTDQEFAMGNDYDIFLSFNKTGGILLYDYYFTQNGEPTNIPVTRFEPGDPILPTEDSEMYLDLTVKPWEDQEQETTL